MAVLSGNRIAWTYTDDEGNDWRVAAQKALTDQGVLGGSAAAGTVPERPNFFKMRRVSVSDGAGHSRVLPCYETTATIVTPGTAVNANYAGVSTPFTSNGGYIPERAPRRNVTKQAA
jgi:hypothetical protein